MVLTMFNSPRPESILGAGETSASLVLIIV